MQLTLQRAGPPLTVTYKNVLAFTGKVVALIVITLAAGMVIWGAIKFQVGMGIQLTFMVIWNMIGALLLIPALSHFLLKKAP